MAAERMLFVDEERPAETPSQAKEGRVVLFMHGKGGVGTTTTAVNVGVALAAKGEQVGLLDLSLPHGNAALMLDLQPPRNLAGLANSSYGVSDDAFAQFLVRHASGLQVLAAPDVPEKAELVTAECVEQTIHAFRQMVDILLVDTAYAFSDPLLAALDLKDLVCLVTTPHLAALRATADTMGVLERLGIPERRIMLVLNRTTPSGFDTDQASAFLQRAIDVVIPYNKDFDAAADNGLPLVTHRPKESSAAALRDLASKAALALTAAAA